LPEQVIHSGPAVGRVALLGADLPGLRPRLLCEQGNHVMRGEALFHDRAHPEIVFVSPISGVIDTITLGPRRSLSALVIRSETGQHEPDPVTMAMSSAAEVRAALLAQGFWPAFPDPPFRADPCPGCASRGDFRDDDARQPTRA
jgi:Na+-transporting NADH:ubiquinone oxidoreductase subunit A